ncbi:MAG: coenzyme F420-0:L-glutamate ligase [Rhizobiaceae bacterium]|nr:coenzyme F420-0:L-glutamate ligase [Rhizobiaceae bacterium]
MTLAVAILMKDPAQAKTRLKPVLGSDARERLALLMFENTLDHFLRLPARLAVVTPSDRIAGIARARGAAAVIEDGNGIDAAAEAARRWALAEGAASLLVVHADIPTLDESEIATLLDAGNTRAVVIGESIDGGTNAILLTPPDAIGFRFGPSSAAAHEAAARSAGRTVARLRLPFLSRDLDTPDDLRAFASISAPPIDATALALLAVRGIPEIRADDDLGAIISEALSAAGIDLEAGDIVVVAQKIVSKSEARLRRLDDFAPSSRALEIADRIGKDARKVEAILSESADVLRAERMGADGLLITRHRAGWICANAGIDESNLGSDMGGMLMLLPEDADASARRIRDRLEHRFSGPVGVLVTDTFGRPWRNGLVNVAIGVAGVPALVDWAGRGDAYGRALKATLPALADEVAAAAGLLMQKDAGVPVVVVRGLEWTDRPEASARDVLRPIAQELFQ